MARGFWTDTRIAQLKRLWRAGNTAGAIGAKLGGISRAAVLGKLFRLRLAAADDERDADADAPARRRARKVMPVNDSRPARPRRRTLFELTNACCRWPYGELGRGRFFFCGEVGADLARGIPYCPRHMQRAYIVPPTLVKPLHKIIARAAITSRQRPSPQLAIKRAPSISARCGSGVNGLDTGSVAANTWYAVFAIYNPTTKTTAALLSTSTTSPTLPSGYTYLTRVGWMRTSASSQFLRVLQQGRRAQYVVTAASNTANLPIMVTGVNGSVSTPTWTCD